MLLALHSCLLVLKSWMLLVMVKSWMLVVKIWMLVVVGAGSALSFWVVVTCYKNKINNTNINIIIQIK
jgi:hypothetical protein